jgi:hypothetical protein
MGIPRGRILGGKRRGRRTHRRDHRDRPADQLGSGRRQSIDVIVGPAIFDHEVLSLDIAGFAEASAECRQKRRVTAGRGRTENSDHRHRRLLRAHRERPSGRTAEKGDELAASNESCHLIPPI